MDTDKLKQLVEEGKSSRKIAEYFGCSQSSVRWHLGKTGLKTNPKYERKGLLKTDTHKTCTDCKTLKPLGDFYLNSTGRLHTYCKVCITKKTVCRQRVFKTKCVEYKGGKCEKCGYCKNNSALEFHHTDPTSKDFNIANARHTTFGEKVKAELDKCLLVCSNCHREIHDELYNGVEALR